MTEQKDTPQLLKELSNASDAPPDVARGHEVRDLGAKYLVWLGIGVFVFLIIGIAIPGALFHYQTKMAKSADRAPSPLVDSQPIAAGPMLQVLPAEEMKDMRLGERRALESYGWVDRNAGVVRIPIDRAMDLIAQRGLPARAQPEKR